MNYIEQLNAFFLKKEQDALSSRAQCLYLNLIGLNNRYRWVAWFSVSGLLLQGMTGLSRNQLTQARAELAEKGYLCYEKKAGSRTGRYHLEDLCAQPQDRDGAQAGVQTETQARTQTETQTETQPVRKAAPLYLIKTKEKEKQKETTGAPTAQPSVSEVKAFIAETGSGVDPELFTTYYRARGWQAGGQPIRSWQAMVRAWDRREALGSPGRAAPGGNPALRYAQRAPAERAALEAVVQY